MNNQSVELTAYACNQRAKPIRLPRAKVLRRKVDIAVHKELRAHKRSVKQQVRDYLRRELDLIREELYTNARSQMYNLVYLAPQGLFEEAKNQLISILQHRLERAGYTIKPYAVKGCIKPNSFVISW